MADEAKLETPDGPAPEGRTPEGRAPEGRDPAAQPNRRDLLTTASSVAMTAGLTGGYGAFAWISGRFLYPARPGDRQWQFVSEVDRLEAGQALLYRGPSGETIHVTRQKGTQSGSGASESDFIALSSTCPHLGCQVSWEPQHDRYFCPCHNGTFDADGIGTGGPPGDAGQVLPRYPLKVENGLLYIEVPVVQLASGETGRDEIPGDETTVAEGGVIEAVEGIHGPGHDPCLGCGPGLGSGLGNDRNRGGGRRA